MVHQIFNCCIVHPTRCTLREKGYAVIIQPCPPISQYAHWKHDQVWWLSPRHTPPNLWGKLNSTPLSGISESIYNLDNLLIRYPSWSTPPPCLPALVLLWSIAASRPLIEIVTDFPNLSHTFPMPDNSSGIIYHYIDDVRPICVDMNDNAKWCPMAVALTIYAFDQLIRSFEPLPWNVLLVLVKLYR